MPKKTIFAWKPTRDLIKSVGGLIVQRDAVDFLNSWMEEKAKALVSNGLKLVQHGHRKKLTRDDLDLVAKGF